MVAALFTQEILYHKIDGKEDSKQGKNDCKDRSGVKPLVNFKTPENPGKNDDQHLESHAGIAGVLVKVFLRVRFHPASPESGILLNFPGSWYNYPKSVHRVRWRFCR